MFEALKHGYESIYGLFKEMSLSSAIFTFAVGAVIFLTVLYLASG